MGKWIIIWGAIGLIAWLVSATISLRQKAAASKHRVRAKQLLDSGDWEGAAALYKKAILERLDNLSAIQDLATAVFRGHP